MQFWGKGDAALTRRPVVWFAVSWAAGYAAAYDLQPAWAGIYSSMLFGLLLCAVWRWRAGAGMLAALRAGLAALLVCAAAAGVYAEYDRSNQTTVTASEADAVRFVGRIVTPVTVDGDRVAFRAAAGKGMDWTAEGEQFQINIRLLRQEEQTLAAAWRRGDAVVLEGTLKRPAESRNFGGFDYREYLRLQHVHWQLSVKGTEALVITPPAQGEWGFWRLLRWNDRIREAIGERIELVFPEEQSGFMKSMLIGLRDDMDPQQFDRFSKLGMTHILAISGMHVAVFLGCVLWLLRRTGLTREACLKIGIVLVPVYVLLTGAGASIVRAGIMAMIGLYASYRNRLKDGLHVLMLAGTIMLVWNPYYLSDVSFQLSFLVTLGLILGVPALNRSLPARWKPPIRDAVSITVVAQLVSFPLTIYYFNQFSLLSFPANFLLVPVLSLFVMPAGSVAVAIGALTVSGGQAAAWLVARVNGFVLAVVEWLNGWDGPQMIWPKPGLPWVGAFYCLLAACAAVLPEARSPDAGGEEAGPMLTPVRSRFAERLLRLIKGPWPLVLAAAAMTGLLWYGYAPDRFSREGHVQFIDVGQGDSILIRSPIAKRHVLVDGGGTVVFRKPGEEWKQRKDPYEVGRKLLVPLLRQRGVQQLDYVVLTHQDADHSGGLQAVLEHIPVERLLFNGTLKRTPPVEKLFRTALERGTDLIPVYAGDRIELDEETSLHFLYPLPPERRDAIRIEEEQNSSSVVFHMTMSGTRWLFTGDMDEKAERQLLAYWRSDESPGASGGTALDWSRVDVLKVAHHGSRSSTSELWLSAWRPAHAVISAGVNNIYRHPSPVVLDRLNRYGSTILRTDLQGEIQAKVKDGRLYMRTKLQEAASSSG